MKTYKPHIKDYGYPLRATDELREALNSLGFKFVQPHINRGCHWGDVYFFEENLELAKSMMDPMDRYFRIDTATHYFYLSPYNQDEGGYWQFSVISNKPREYKHIVRKKKRAICKNMNKNPTPKSVPMTDSVMNSVKGISLRLPPAGGQGII